MLSALLVLGNVQCFARCLAQPCDQIPASCHSHGKSNSSQCPQNQMRAAASSVAAVDWSLEFIPVDRPLAVMRAQQSTAEPDPSPAPQPAFLASPPLRI
jgi:hypothetical protein